MKCNFSASFRPMFTTKASNKSPECFLLLMIGAYSHCHTAIMSIWKKFWFVEVIKDNFWDYCSHLHKDRCVARIWNANHMQLSSSFTWKWAFEWRTTCDCTMKTDWVRDDRIFWKFSDGYSISVLVSPDFLIPGYVC